MKKLIFLFCFVLFSCQSTNPQIEKANQLLNQKQFKKALKQYQSIKKNTLNQKEKSVIYHNSATCLFQLAKIEFSNENYIKAKNYYTQLISYYPNSEHFKQAQKDKCLSQYFLSKQFYENKSFHKVIDEIESIKNIYLLAEKQQQELNHIIADSLFSIAQEHFNQNRFYYSYHTAHKILLNYGTYSNIKEVNTLIEQAYIKDARKQFQAKAYSNSQKILKRLLVEYPNSPFKNEAKNLLNKIKPIIQQETKAKKKTAAKTLNYYDKGNKENPLTNEDLDKLAVFLKEKKQRNPEWVKKEYFPLYEGKLVQLDQLIYKSYEKNKPKSQAAPIPIAPEHPLKKILTHDPVKEEQKKKALKYKVYLKNKEYIILYLNQKTFLGIDFRKTKQSLYVKGKIKDIEIIENKIKINIAVDTLRQK